MRKINSIEVSSDGQTANIGGGVKSKDITDALWPLKKPTGVSLVPPVLYQRKPDIRSHWLL